MHSLHCSSVCTRRCSLSSFVFLHSISCSSWQVSKVSRECKLLLFQTSWHLVVNMLLQQTSPL